MSPKERVALHIEMPLSASGELPTEFPLFKAGTNRTTKGDLTYTPAAKKAVEAFAADLGRDLVIDYEHASLNADTAPDPAKAGEAAGWFSVDAREDGIYAVNVSWTDEASERLKARKFRYFSPVVFRDPKTREITGVLNAALTNNPATKGQKPLVASATTQEKPMSKLATLVKLAADATEDAIAAEVSKAIDGRELLLAATGKATVGEASAAIATWKKDAEQVAALSAKLAELEGKQKAGEVLSLIKAAQAEGKVAPAQVALLEKMGARSMDELKEFLSAAPKVLPTPAKEPGAGTTTVMVTDEDKKVAEMLSVKVEDLAKSKAANPIVRVQGLNERAE